MATTTTPAQTGQSRLYVIDGRARPDHQPSYMSQVVAGGISQDFGDITSIEVPNPNKFDDFVEIGTIRGAQDRATVTLTGHYAREIKSELLRLARKKCSIDVHINFGSCTDPTDYNRFDKKIVLEDARLTNWSSEDVGALTSDDRAVIDESVDLAAREVYEIVELSFAERAASVVTNEVVDVTLCDSESCGDCEEESTGYQKIFAVTVAAGGSPSTPADVVFSINGGTTWYAHDVDTMGASDNADGIACLGQYLFVISEDTESLHYATKSDFDGTTDPSFTEVTTGFVASAGPRAVATSGTVAFIVGAGGYIYKSTDVTSGVSVLDAGALTTADFNDVFALSEEFAVAVGNDGHIVKTEDGTIWAAAGSPVALNVGINLNAVCLLSKNTWLVGTATGVLYYTTNGGTTWTAKGFNQSGTGVIHDIVAAGDSVLYMSHALATPSGRILRSSNGGYDWVVMPEGSGTLTANDRINALVASALNPDFVVGVGLADNGSDGFVIVSSG